jgi:hypothetical protein
MPRASGATKFKLQPADPFDLIRWLARTQSDPRKAVAELVQNSIDARARTVTIERRRMRGRGALVIRDDGEGVLPQLPREEALRYLGTHIGHSHKLGLSPTERHARVIAGQYGVGLLGFWAIGARMEMRSRVAGSDVHALALVEDRPTAILSKLPHELDAPPTYTELVIFDVHEAAMRPLAGRRLSDYLAAELRGPLLSTGVELEVHDHMVRGAAQRRFTVTPKRFEGLPLDVPTSVDVDGYPPIRVELYLARGADRPAIQLACAGTLVAEDIADIDSLGFTHSPWRGRELAGLIDFPSFAVPPGTRRGVVPNAAAAAFARALARVEPAITGELERLDRKRRLEADRHLVDDLRKALRGLHERLPQYDLPGVERGTEAAPGGPGAALSEASAAPEPESHAPQQPLFAAGPLASVEIVPSVVAVAPSGERRVLARARDAEGHRVRDVAFIWTIEGDGFAIVGDGARPAVAASGELLPGAEGRLAVEARHGEHLARAVARVVADVDAARGKSAPGVPKPQLVDAPGAPWRSRMVDDAWQVNAGHEDYLALEDGRPRLRYIISLLGKEIVARTYAQPGAGELLEHLVAVIAHAERNLRANA